MRRAESGDGLLPRVSTRMIRAMGFDLDNTLFDHREAASRGLESLVLAKGWKYQSDQDMRHEWHRLEELYFDQFVTGVLTLTEHRRARMRDLLASTDSQVEEEHLDALWNEYLMHYSNSWVAFSDAHTTLSEFKAAGYKLGVLTNGQQSQQEAKLKAMGLAHLFDAVLAIGTVEAMKPDPRAFAQLCRILECDPDEVLFVGDDLEYDVRPAINSGLRGVWLNRNGTQAPKDIDHQAESLSELKVILHSINNEKA
jgi:putative hydrolase of the HAD superfamily